MAYVEPQHNAAKPTSATRGVLMGDQGKEAALRARARRLGTDSDHTIQTLDSNAAFSPAADRGASRGGLSEHTRNRLAAQLRTMYDSITQQPVPDRFADLIAKLDSGDREKA
jgi:hypothetical protein